MLGLYRNKRERFERQATFLPPFLYCSPVGAGGATTLSHLDLLPWSYSLPYDDVVDTVDQPGSSSSSVAG